MEESAQKKRRLEPASALGAAAERRLRVAGLAEVAPEAVPRTPDEKDQLASSKAQSSPDSNVADYDVDEPKSGQSDGEAKPETSAIAKAFIQKYREKRARAALGTVKAMAVEVEVEEPPEPTGERIRQRKCGQPYKEKEYRPWFKHQASWRDKSSDSEELCPDVLKTGECTYGPQCGFCYRRGVPEPKSSSQKQEATRTRSEQKTKEGSAAGAGNEVENIIQEYDGETVEFTLAQLTGILQTYGDDDIVDVLQGLGNAALRESCAGFSGARLREILQEHVEVMALRLRREREAQAYGRSSSSSSRRQDGRTSEKKFQ